MAKWCAVLILALVVAAVVSPSFAIAAGGGGGGGNGGGGGGGGSGGGSGGGGGSGPHLTGFKCLDTGQVVFDQKPLIAPVVLWKRDSTPIEVKGEWTGTFFSSEEAELVEEGNYTLADPVNGNKTVSCPGLKFSCKLVNISMKSCTTSAEGITAEFAMAGPGVSAENVTVEFAVRDSPNKLKHSKGAYSSQLKNLTITSAAADNYLITVPKWLPVTKVQVAYNGCVGRYYAYSQTGCVLEMEAEKGSAATAVKEVPGKELKCGGYMDIEDRVNCRLQLREEEKGEYENFFPEECKARNDKDKCLGVYRAVQPCWSFPNGPSRIGCVKKALNLGELTSEVAKCSGVAADQKRSCSDELRDKVHSLVKFRLYNLEEEAEELMEEGLLTREDVAGFVVKMEQAKLAFNDAATNKERKEIILQARQVWNGLLAKRRAK